MDGSLYIQKCSFKLQSQLSCYSGNLADRMYATMFVRDGPYTIVPTKVCTENYFFGFFGFSKFSVFRFSSKTEKTEKTENLKIYHFHVLKRCTAQSCSPTCKVLLNPLIINPSFLNRAIIYN